MKYFTVMIALLLLVGGVAADSGTLRIGNFAESGLLGWSEKSFRGNTAYRIVADSGRKVLQAESKAAASGLIYNIEYDPAKYPVLSWRWKIAHTIENGDSRTRSGDDYAARIYVVFPHWFFPKTRTLNYIWANRLPKGEAQANAFTANAIMIAVESGNGNAGVWISERRNIIDDYRRVFGEDPPQVGAIAIMTDADNTGASATAWYDEIVAGRL